MQVYIQQEKEYREQDKAVQKLKSWITNTVAPHYFKIACDPTKTLANWYANLEKHVGVSNYASQMSARERYQEALKPLTKSKDWSKWLANWETAITLAQEKNILEASSIVSWVTNFFMAVRPIAET
jgi:hypothetical protein